MNGLWGGARQAPSISMTTVKERILMSERCDGKAGGRIVPPTMQLEDTQSDDLKAHQPRKSKLA
jgi:hypothetical protein